MYVFLLLQTGPGKLNTNQPMVKPTKYLLLRIICRLSNLFLHFVFLIFDLNSVYPYTPCRYSPTLLLNKVHNPPSKTYDPLKETFYFMFYVMIYKKGPFKVQILNPTKIVLILIMFWFCLTFRFRWIYSNVLQGRILLKTNSIIARPIYSARSGFIELT